MGWVAEQCYHYCMACLLPHIQNIDDLAQDFGNSSALYMLPVFH